MNINIKHDKNTMTVILDGELDYKAAQELKEALNGQFKNVWEMVYDLKDLKYVSSAGVRIFLENELLMRNKGGLRFCNVNEMVMDVFKMVGLDKVFKFG